VAFALISFNLVCASTTNFHTLAIRLGGSVGVGRHFPTVYTAKSYVLKRTWYGSDSERTHSGTLTMYLRFRAVKGIRM